MSDDLEYVIIVILSILFVFGAMFLGIYTSVKEQESYENVYNLLMSNELEFVDNYIEAKYKSNGVYYIIVYKENEEIKQAKVNLQQYYEIIEKYQKTIDKEQ